MPIIKLAAGEGCNYHYEFDPSLKPLGEGGMGRVYRGYRVNAMERTPVAIKSMYEYLPEDVIERARTEASIRIKNDNLVEMLDFIEEHTVDRLGTKRIRYYVVSELLMGVSLDDMLQGKYTNQNGDPVPFAQELIQLRENNPYIFAITVMRSVLMALIALHNAGYVHRDIDPTNIMITQDGQIKLIDFGIVKRMKTSTRQHIKKLTNVGMRVGKVTYAPRELLLGEVDSHNVTTDIYLAGALLYHLLVGVPPFTGPDRVVVEKHISENFPMAPVRQKAIADVIKKACSKKQSKRFNTASEFLYKLDNLLNLPYPDERSSSIWKYVGIAGVVAAVAVVGYFVVSLISGKEQESAVAAAPADSYQVVCTQLADENTFEDGILGLDSLVAENDHRAMSLRSRLYLGTLPGANNPKWLNDIYDNAELYGLKTDSVQAHRLRIRAVQINPTATGYIELAEDYTLGIGVPKDKKKALGYLDLAMDNAEDFDEEERIQKLIDNLDYNF